MKLLELIKFDTSNFLQEEYDLLIGVDEVGRGSLAGTCSLRRFFIRTALLH